MSREIKFRAWDKTRQRMYHDVLGRTIGVAEWDLPSMLENPGIWEVMQFTGLKDKNGKDIYEGDILELASLKATVVWLNGAFCFKHDNASQEPSHVRQENTRLWEVIGNIHENPSLLEYKP